MKNLFKYTLAAAFVLVSHLTALAQGFSSYSAPITLLSSQFIVGGATSNYTAVIDGRLSENIALELTSRSHATNANAYTVTIQRSIDGSNWDTTTAHMTWALTGNGTNSMRHLTNFTTLGYGYFRVVSIANANPDTTLTNLSMRYVIKR